MARLETSYGLVVAFAMLLILARFSEAFLLLRAESTGLTATYAPVILIVMNVAYAAGAYPFGHLSDRLTRRSLLVVGRCRRGSGWNSRVA
jgi:MFS family permease